MAESTNLSKSQESFSIYNVLMAIGLVGVVLSSLSILKNANSRQQEQSQSSASAFRQFPYYFR